MKRYVSVWLMGWLCLFSCQNDLEDLSSDTMMLEEVSEAGAFTDIGGTSPPAGYGYDQLKDKPYSTAIGLGDVYRNNQGIDGALPYDVSVKAIENRDSLSSFIARNSEFNLSIGSDNPGGPPPTTPDETPSDTLPPVANPDNPSPLPAPSPELNFVNAESSSSTNLLEVNGNSVSASLRKVRSLEEKMDFGETMINVVAKIKVATDQYYTNDSPTLTPEAQALLASDPRQFFGKYGTALVSANLLGGELYYVYSFDTRNSTISSRRGRLTEAEAALENIFNVGVSRSDSSAEFSTSFRELTNASVVSYVPGFSPASTVRDEDAAKAEAERLLEYLETNPQDAISIDKKLLPYAAFVQSPELLAEWETRLECYRSYEQWKLMEARLEEVVRTPGISDQLREDAKVALYDAAMQISNAESCGPAADAARYQPLLDQWEQEWNGETAGGSTVSLYRFYSEERTNSYYTTDPETVEGIDGGSSYQLKEVMGKIFRQPAEGTTWLREAWYNQGDDHRYNTELYVSEENEHYEFVRDLGYIYRDNNGLDQGKIRKLHLFYNDEVKDHLMTTDPQAEAFGSPNGGDGYVPLGTLGYILAED